MACTQFRAHERVVCLSLRQAGTVTFTLQLTAFFVFKKMIQKNNNVLRMLKTFFCIL